MATETTSMESRARLPLGGVSLLLLMCLAIGQPKAAQHWRQGMCRLAAASDAVQVLMGARPVRGHATRPTNWSEARPTRRVAAVVHEDTGCAPAHPSPARHFVRVALLGLPPPSAAA